MKRLLAIAFLVAACSGPSTTPAPPADGAAFSAAVMDLATGSDWGDALHLVEGKPDLQVTDGEAFLFFAPRFIGFTSASQVCQELAGIPTARGLQGLSLMANGQVVAHCSVPLK
jgi:hypothetical protein